VLAALGDEVSFSITVTGPGAYSFVWQKDEANLPSGPDADTVTLSSVVLTDAGRYRVIVSNAFGSVTSPPMVLRFPAVGTLANAVPEITHLGDLPAGQIGVGYSYFIPVRQDDADGQIQRQPLKFTCSGLPKGLKCNAVTGEIAGVPLVSKALPYQVVMMASNKRGKSLIRAALEIAPLRAGMVGTFAGPVGRDGALNGGLGWVPASQGGGEWGGVWCAFGGNQTSGVSIGSGGEPGDGFTGQCGGGDQTRSQCDPATN
jgi:hypothetical protein